MNTEHLETETINDTMVAAQGGKIRIKVSQDTSDRWYLVVHVYAADILAVLDECERLRAENERLKRSTQHYYLKSDTQEGLGDHCSICSLPAAALIHRMVNTHMPTEALDSGWVQ